ncbi:MAG: hypothetical protein COV44_07420 [Deltaproteobacteria bacterium CG11_big_fil_rev_8_21_14_0_20_45_16]|nr:MAG: hypothetical protein COV44_07420 [Deltaproteobacteria bacterium CG11_big_fil_rev_8_21_14_0_20_45_16]
MNQTSPNKYSGLTEFEVRQKQFVGGYNELPASSFRNFLKVLVEIVCEPMVYLLLGCAIIYLFLGNSTESISLVGFLILILVITISQEFKAENALKALKDLTSPRALVIRGGKRKRVAGRELVTNDIVIINEGDRIPAAVMRP